MSSLVIACQVYPSMGALVQQLRFSVDEIRADKNVIFFGKALITSAFSRLVGPCLVDNTPCELVGDVLVLVCPYYY